MHRSILKGFHPSGCVINSLDSRLKRWTQEFEKIRKVFGYLYYRIEIRNQSRQVFQKLIDECNQKINPRPNLLVVDEEEEGQ